jgi:hypothetical protein
MHTDEGSNKDKSSGLAVLSPTHEICYEAENDTAHFAFSLTAIIDISPLVLDLSSTRVLKLRKALRLFLENCNKSPVFFCLSCTTTKAEEKQIIERKMIQQLRIVLYLAALLALLRPALGQLGGDIDAGDIGSGFGGMYWYL